MEEEEDEEVEEEEEEDEGKVVYILQGYDKMHAYNDGILPTLFEEHDRTQLHITEIQMVDPVTTLIKLKVFNKFITRSK